VDLGGNLAASHESKIPSLHRGTRGFENSR
jgi:hypothetical protein